MTCLETSACIAWALLNDGFEVELVGRRLPNSLPVPYRGYQTYRMRLLFQKGKLFYLEYNVRLFFLLLFRRVDILTANDLDTLLANFLVAKIRRKKLVYDSHEYFTEVPELIDRPLTRKIWLGLESWIFPRLQHVYTVNTSIAEAYTQKYGVSTRVIRNLPISKEEKPSGIRNRLIYQGALNVGRGIELMIDAMAFLPDHELWIVGKGDIEAELQERALPLIQQGAKISFRGFVPPEKLAELSAEAGIGLSLEEDLGLNYHYASPNKMYDYLQAGLPILVSDLPEMSKLIETYQVGQVLPEAARTPVGLAQKIQEISQAEQYEMFQKKAILAARELNWEKEQVHLLNIYRNL